MDIKQQIRDFVSENAQSKGVTNLADDTSLMGSGVLDSLGIFRLVSFLEESFGVRVADEEIIHDNFQSINQIENFVNMKLKKKETARA